MTSLEEKAKKLAEQRAKEQAIDWEGERDWWIEKLDELYQCVREWLQPFVDAGQLNIVSEPMLLKEDHIGSYEAPRMILDFSGVGVVLEPQGTLLIGSQGRVDVFRRGRRTRHLTMLILEGARESPTWGIWPSRDPKERQDLDEDSFKTLVSSLL